MVSLNPFGFDDELAPLVGHELQHVAEIADEQGVRDADGLRALLLRIGWRTPGSTDGFETQAAVAAGMLVRAELAHRARNGTWARR